MDEDRVKEIVNAMRFFGGKRDMSLDELAMVQPGLARIMPEIGARTWKLYYAVKAANAWHEKKEKPYIRWEVPDFPPPDLDFTPRKK